MDSRNNYLLIEDVEKSSSNNVQNNLDKKRKIEDISIFSADVENTNNLAKNKNLKLISLAPNIDFCEANKIQISVSNLLRIRLMDSRQTSDEIKAIKIDFCDKLMRSSNNDFLIERKVLKEYFANHPKSEVLKLAREVIKTYSYRGKATAACTNKTSQDTNDLAYSTLDEALQALDACIQQHELNELTADSLSNPTVRNNLTAEVDGTNDPYVVKLSSLRTNSIFSIPATSKEKFEPVLVIPKVQVKKLQAICGSILKEKLKISGDPLNNVKAWLLTELSEDRIPLKLKKYFDIYPRHLVLKECNAAINKYIPKTSERKTALSSLTMPNETVKEIIREAQELLRRKIERRINNTNIISSVKLEFCKKIIVDINNKKFTILKKYFNAQLTSEMLIICKYVVETYKSKEDKLLPETDSTILSELAQAKKTLDECIEKYKSEEKNKVTLNSQRDPIQSNDNACNRSQESVSDELTNSIAPTVPIGLHSNSNQSVDAIYDQLERDLFSDITQFSSLQGNSVFSARTNLNNTSGLDLFDFDRQDFTFI